MEVRLNSILEIFYARIVLHRNNISIFNINVQTFLLRKGVELVLKVLGIFLVFINTENSPLLEVNWLVHDRSQNACVFQASTLFRLGIYDLRSFENLSFDCIRLEIDIKLPLLNLIWIADHFIELADTLHSIFWLLEQTLSDISHDPFVLSDFGGNSNKNTKFWRQIYVLLFLSDFKERLFHRLYFSIVSLDEIL